MFTIRQENEKQLEKMRETVDEKLNNSLSQRLNDSFSKIQQSLESVNTGLGEMRTLATGVGDLKKVLTNVKTRGGWGEITLSTLLEQTLAPSQYDSQVQVKANSKERVDFIVKLPGKDAAEVWLPIDSKFPLEDYNRLLDVDVMDKDALEKCQKQLKKRIEEEAKSIKEKYINLPTTTDFAIMFLPTENLYDEVNKNTELFEKLQTQYKVIVCGPTTLTALLNSLQLGFKTLAIEKRSSELWQLISAFRQEFSKFMGLLDKTKTKLKEATNNIEQAQLSSGKIDKKLSAVSNDVGIAYDDEDDDKDKLPPTEE
ncbi:MAG: DNA recombination protein RmuC [Clostridia bacterium]|nr:DNA recombination protein RmuC [Clostridia bacterium]